MPTNISFNYNYYPVSNLPFNVTVALLLAAAAFIVLGFVMVRLGRRRRIAHAAGGNAAPGATKKNLLAALAIVIGLGIGAVVLYRNAVQNAPIPVFAPKTMLSSLWENYKKDFIEPVSSRTVDPSRGNITTSEGEGYTMLRATWMDDEPTFDASWAWTQKNLQNKNDHLFAWLYGTKSDGTEGILADQGGENSASDADTDIALALVFAYSRWQNPQYLRAALPVIADIWTHEVVTRGGAPYLVASDAAAIPNQADAVDPSYFSPYAYRIFSVLDRAHNWTGLINTSYEVLHNSMQMPLDTKTSAGLPPDWIMVTPDGTLTPPPAATGMTTDFGYDALRVPWRIALDWEWNAEPRAKAALENMGFLGTAWAADGRLDAVYAHDGSPVAAYEAPAMYGGAMGYFAVADLPAAQAVYLRKLQSLYNPDTETWKLPLSYYDANIVWFGMALYDGALPNLFSLNQ